MDYRKVELAIRNNGNFNNGRNFRMGLNKIRYHSKNETIEHFMTKAMLGFLILSKDRGGFVSEAEMVSSRTIDLVQITKEHGNLVGYEIETLKNEKHFIRGVDIIEIPLTQMPPEAKIGLESLKKWLEIFIV
jgi:hypothetical protein